MSVQTGPGWMPGVEQQISPNISTGRGKVAIAAVVIHIMEGGFQSSIDWMKKAGTSAHFAVRKDGHIAQLVNIFDVAYANGLTWDDQRGVWIDPQGDAVTPAWPLLEPPTNPNWQTISVEHEGMSGEAWTEAMYAADQHILAYVQSEIPIEYHVGTSLIGHCDISPVNRAHCPGPGVDLSRVAASIAQPTYERTYRVRYNRSVVRQGPATSFPVAAYIDAGREFLADSLKFGETIKGTDEWIHLADGVGFITATAVERVLP